MDVEGANETDVREEVAAPFLTLLGYQRGTENDILRELSISYGHNFLGRKKNNDTPLRGRSRRHLTETPSNFFDDFYRFRGRLGEHVDMPHLPPGARLGFAVQVQPGVFPRH